MKRLAQQPPSLETVAQEESEQYDDPPPLEEAGARHAVAVAALSEEARASEPDWIERMRRFELVGAPAR